MTRVEALAIAAPLIVAAVLGLFGLATNYFDDKATAKRATAKSCWPWRGSGRMHLIARSRKQRLDESIAGGRR